MDNLQKVKSYFKGLKWHDQFDDASVKLTFRKLTISPNIYSKTIDIKSMKMFIL